MPGILPKRLLTFAFTSLFIGSSLVSCSLCPRRPKGCDNKDKLIISVRDQKLMLVSDGIPIRSYKVSTSKFGIGDRPGSYRTPIGHLKVAKMIGAHAPLGSVFKNRHRTGEIVKPNSPGRDPIVTRIIWLRGTEARNRFAYSRGIYIHGTPQENKLGTPRSYGCIRMSSLDVTDLYKRINYGADVFIIKGSIKAPTPSRATAFLQDLRFSSDG